jgi:hypothetical protein
MQKIIASEALSFSLVDQLRDERLRMALKSIISLVDAQTNRKALEMQWFTDNSSYLFLAKGSQTS